MTQEELKELAKKYAYCLDEEYKKSHNLSDKQIEEIFFDGAEITQINLIDKACEWLELNVCNAYNFRGDDISIGFVEQFRKAMKGDANSKKHRKIKSRRIEHGDAELSQILNETTEELAGPIHTEEVDLHSLLHETSGHTIKPMDLQEFQDNEHLTFLISHEEGTDDCILYIRVAGRTISDFYLTRENLDILKTTIEKCFEIW